MEKPYLKVSVSTVPLIYQAENGGVYAGVGDCKVKQLDSASMHQTDYSRTHYSLNRLRVSFFDSGGQLIPTVQQAYRAPLMSSDAMHPNLIRC